VWTVAVVKKGIAEENERIELKGACMTTEFNTGVPDEKMERIHCKGA